MRSEFEKNRYWIGLFKTDVEFNGLLGQFGRYELNGSRDVDHGYLEDFNSKWEAYAKAWQHQQSKVDELQVKLNGAEERALTCIKYKDKYLAERDWLQKENAALVHVVKSRDIQLENEKHKYDELMNKLVDSGMKNAELQKRVDDLTQVVKELLEEMKYPTATFEEVICSGVRGLEQALKGGEACQ